MKTSKKIWAACFAFSSLFTLNVNAQWYGQEKYAHDSTILCSAKITMNTPGYVMAGYRPVRPVNANSADFVIDQVDAAGGFSAGTFAKTYRIILNCPSFMTTYNCSGVSIIETNNGGNGEAYAIAGSCDVGMFFATLDNAGNIINQNFWDFMGVGPNWKPAIRESVTNPGDYYICGAFNGYAYVVKVDKMGNQLWGNYYYDGTSGAHDLIESPYNANELIVVGRVDIQGSTTAADAFFMSLNAATGVQNYMKYYQYLFWDSDDWFNSIDIAKSGTGGKGYVLGGRAVGPSVAPNPNPTITSARHSQWMCKLDQNGNVVWSTLIKHSGTPFAPLTSGPAIERVYERQNPNSGTYEYYGVAGGSAFSSNLVVYKLDDNGNNTANPNEFTYTSAYGPSGVIIRNYCDLTAIETGGGSDDGLQVFGTDLVSQEHYMIKTYFNGVSGCNETITTIDSIFPGPHLSGPAKFKTLPFNVCGTPALSVGNGPASVANNCYASSVMGGSNLRTVGLQAIENSRSIISISPNPASHSVRLTLQEKATVVLYNNLGQKISTYAFDAGSPEIDLHELNISKGIYSLEISTAKGAQAQKLVYDPE